MRDERRQNWALALSLLMGALVVVLLGLLYQDLIFPPRIIDVDEPIRVLNPERRVTQGSVLELEVHYTKYTNEPAQIGMILASQGTILMLHSTMSAFPMGEHRIKLLVGIPHWTPPGNYKLYMAREQRYALRYTAPLLFQTEAFDVIYQPPGREP